MKLPRLTKNWITIIGAIIAAINFLLILVLFIISTIFNNSNTNIGLFIYIILPGFLVLGLLMIPVGMIMERRRLKKATDTSRGPLPYIDLNDVRHRNAFVIFTVTTIIVLFLSTLGSFKAYHITESVEFCGKLCHKVMEPEYTAYQNSPHANVTCVECHVGSGASWYIKSKLSGLHQVYAVMTKSYPTPIATPLHDLRPARETCEKCHWPQKFYARSMQTNKYFLTDSLNSEWDVMLQMKTGPEYVGLGFREGIHWHINPSVRIEYISENDKRETINWVKYTNTATGEITVYKNDSNNMSDSAIIASNPRTMDCIDCHNRPSHNYKSPSVFVDNALLTGAVSKEIPYIKKVAMGILSQQFGTKDSAMTIIHDSISNFYRTTYPSYFEKNNELINKAITSIQNSYNQNTFPAMKVSYQAYPEHIGHLETNGCFRCHNDTFKAQNGRVISKDCSLCHSILGQGKPGSMQMTTVKESLAFTHPVDIENAWKEMNCSECHNKPY
ncbi:MAG: NapC/NirT family cytochrome c [Bacteroidales bacterium]